MRRFSLSDSPPPPAVGEACVHAQYQRADCRACMDACPCDAITRSASVVDIDDERCLRCGRCLYVCPTQALVNIPPPVRYYRSGLLVAPFSPLPPEINELLIWHAKYHIRGVEMLPDEHPLWVMAVAGLNLELAALEEPGWQIVPPPKAQVNVGLRRLLSAGQAASRSATVAGGSAEARRAFPAFSRFTPQLDVDRCLLCGACARACPQQALAQSAGQFSLDPARCSGCGICTAVCPAQAIRVIPGIRPARAVHYATDAARCTDCGRSFIRWPTQGSRCPLCEKHPYSMRG